MEQGSRQTADPQIQLMVLVMAISVELERQVLVTLRQRAEWVVESVAA